MRIDRKYLALLFVFTFMGLVSASAAHADDEPLQLPASVQGAVPSPLSEVGSGTYERLTFDIYRAALWAPDGTYDPTQPYALQLHYERDLSKDTLVNTVMSNIKEQKVADKDTLARWQKKIKQTLPAVKEGDELIGVEVPGKKTKLFLNGNEIASFSDAALSSAFFNIWLGPGADEDLRSELLSEYATDSGGSQTD